MGLLAGLRWQPYLVLIALCAQVAALSGLVPPLLETWGYPVATIGLLVAVSSLTALASRLPGGFLYTADRARWLLLGNILLSVLASALHPVATDLPPFVAVRALAGLGFGVATTINLALFTDGLPPGRARQRALGYYMAGIAVGYSLGAFLAGVIADWFGTTPAFLLAAGFAAVALIGVPPRPSPTGTAAPQEEPFRLRTLGHPRLLAVVVVSFTLSMAFMYWNTYLPLYGLAIGLSLGQVGAIRAAFGLCQVVARPAGGAVVGRLGSTRMMVFGLLVQTVGLMLVPLTDSLAVLLVLFVAHGSARALAIVANAVELVEGAESAGVPRGVMSGVYNTAMDLGNLAGPAVGGLAAAAVGVPGSFFLVPLIGLVGCAAAVLGSRPRPRAVLSS